MVMLLGVPLAFLSAEPARCCTGLKHETNDFHIGASAARRDRAGCGAYVGAVHIQPNALRKRFYHLLAKAGIGTGGAGLCAVVAFLHTFNQRIIRVALNVGMGADHLLSVHVRLTLLCCSITINAMA